MTYILSRKIFGEYPKISVTREQFEQARAAKSYLIDVLAIEEKYNLMMENYAEFEADLVNIALRRVLFTDLDWSAMMTDLHQVNRRLVNVLSTCRLYRDQVSKDLQRLLPAKSPQRPAFRRAVQEASQNEFAFRMMEAMRNYGQHRSLPLHNLKYESSRDRAELNALWRHTLSPEMKVDRLSQDSRFDKSILKELTIIGPEVNLKPYVRIYVREWGKIHQQVRGILAPSVELHQSKIIQLRDHYKEMAGKELSGLAIYKQSREPSKPEPVYLTETYIRRRIWLEQKNSAPRSLDGRYISTH